METSTWRFWTGHGEWFDIQCTLDECTELLQTKLFSECMMLGALELVGTDQ